MILDTESWMNIRRFRALHAAGATFVEIGRECGCDWRTVRKYLAEDASSVPLTGPTRAGTQPLLITPFIPVVEAWLRTDVTIKGTVVYERLVAEYGFPGHYQRVKMFLAEARPRIAAELVEADDNPLAGLHRRFEVVAGAQAQVDWGDEGDLLAHVGVPTVYSFHMVLSHSRDPFSCFTTSMDLATFWDCHRRAFAHFGGVPVVIVYDRTKTVIRRHVAPGWRFRCTQKRRRSPTITASRSMCWPRTGRPGKVGWNGRSISSGTMSSPAATSTPSASLTGRSTPGCRSADPRCTALTGSSSPSALRLTGPRSGACRISRIWWRRSICGGSGKTVSSVSRPAAIPCRHGRSGRGSGYSYRSTSTQPGTGSASTP